MSILAQMVERYEGSRAERLVDRRAQGADARELPRGIVTFRLPIARIEGKAKLSQNKPRAERERVDRRIEGRRRDQTRSR